MAVDGTELDFWIGSWAARWGDAGHGTNRISRILADRVVFEEFEGAGRQDRLVGRSYSVYDPGRRLWRQTWVDDHGSYLDFVGGRVDGCSSFHRRAPESGPGAEQRMVFRDIAADTFRWTWEASDDGGATWTVNWEIAYRRA